MSLKLIKEIAIGSTSFFDLSKEDQRAVVKASTSCGDFSALETVTNYFSGICDYDEHRPYWLKSEFSDSHWQIEIEINGQLTKKSISWDSVVMDDDEKLTNIKHLPLLNAFKYWITAAGNPFHNGGKVSKPVTVYRIILKVILLINGILLRGKMIQLSNNHLQGLSDEFLMMLFVDMSASKNGIYDFSARVRSLLLTKIVEVSDEEAEAFEFKYPYVARSIMEEDKVLGLSLQDRVKACCWLERVNFYTATKLNGKLCGKLSGNNMVLFRLLFSNRIIHSQTTLPKLNELILKGKEDITEYDSIPNTDRSEVMGKSVIQDYISVMKLLNVTTSKDLTSRFPSRLMLGITVSRIREHVKLKNTGRFKTLPPMMVFKLINDCYEFTTKYQVSILSSTLRILETGTLKSTERILYGVVNGKHNKWSERNLWAREDAPLLVDNDLIKLGVNQLFISSSRDDVFAAKRNNEGLADLYDVLVGSIQILVGIFMARRQDELGSLKAWGNLSPKIDPSSEEGKGTNYDLIFINKKSGNGGKHATNEILKRPIPRSIALFIWKLEQFNQKAINAGVNKGELILFNNLEMKTLLLANGASDSYNRKLNSVCDYFETPLVVFENGGLRRYYVRQHQLRRFFSMIFFWSKSFDGLDTLRWMLGHADVEHVYRYISESETGAVMRGIKASYLVDAMQGKKLENIDKLQAAIAQRYGVKATNISLSTLEEAIDDYDVQDYETIPSIESLQERETLESQILELLENDLITLEPEFFTMNKNGQAITDYNLTLQVKELD